jgi:hypothetical protein
MISNFTLFWLELGNSVTRIRFYETVSAEIYGLNLILSDLILKIRPFKVLKYLKIQRLISEILIKIYLCCPWEEIFSQYED